MVSLVIVEDGRRFNSARLKATLLGFLNQLAGDTKGRKEELGLDEDKRKTLAVVDY